MKYLIPALFSICLLGCTEAPTDATTDAPAADTPANVDDAGKAILTVNTQCPIMGGDVTADGGTADFNGKLVGFCCEGCKPEWAKLTDDEKSAKLAAADETDHSGGDNADPAPTDPS